jgi:alpha/beta superfamily hydrolase
MFSKNGNTVSRTAKAKAKIFAIVVAASLSGVSTGAVASAILVHDSFFERYARPDYDRYPGLYCYDRVRDTLKRQLLRIPSGDCHLQGYYYPAEDSRGLAVLAHGFHAGADDYLPLIEALVNRGYSVLTYDVRGVYSSEGDSIIGMCQALRDLDNVLTFADEKQPFADMPKVVIGHSWGGYAASSVLALHSEIRAAALLAPMNNGTTVMLETAEQYAGKTVYSVKPILDTYQKMLFDDYVKYNGVVGINSTDAPVLIAQGVTDTVIAHDGQSITAHLDEIINPNLTVYWGKGAQGSHTGIWHSTEAFSYQKKVTEKLQAIESKLERKLTDEELAHFYDKVDHRRYSEVNAELVDLIVATFDKGIGN